MALWQHLPLEQRDAAVLLDTAAAWPVPHPNTAPRLVSWPLPLVPASPRPGIYRVHCSLNINTETGRLSARRPNLQNQPALEKDRYKVRGGVGGVRVGG